jgi:hypothetical protein
MTQKTANPASLPIPAFRAVNVKSRALRKVLFTSRVARIVAANTQSAAPAPRKNRVRIARASYSYPRWAR